MNWIYLIIAGLFEVAFTTCLGLAHQATGNTKIAWLVGFFICLSISMYLLFQVTKVLPIGISYAVWTGIGAAGSVLVGIFFFKEPVTLLRLFFLITLIISIVGLKMVSSH